MKLAGVIFDLDGTLIDSMTIWDDIAEEYLKMLDIEPTEGLIESLRALTVIQVAQLFCDKFQLTHSGEEILKQLNKMAEDYYTHKIPLKPHVISLLERLRKAGVKMCIATATERYLVEAALDRLGIAGYFEFIITCTEVGVGKEEPVIFNKALELLNTKIEETIIFEDSVLAVETAKKAGFTVIGVFDETFAAEADKIKKIADGYITSFDEWNID